MLFFVQLLDVVAEKFYGVRRKNPLQDMFGDIFKVIIIIFIFFKLLFTTTNPLVLIMEQTIITNRII